MKATGIIRRVVVSSFELAIRGRKWPGFYFFYYLHNFFMQILCILPVDKNPKIGYN